MIRRTSVPSDADVVLGFFLGVIGGVSLVLSKVYAISLLWSWYIVDVGGFTYQPPKLMIYGTIVIAAIYLMGLKGKEDKSKLNAKTNVYYSGVKYLILSITVWLATGIAYAVYYFLA